MQVYTYNGDLNSKLVQYWKGPKLFAHQMVCDSGHVGCLTDGCMTFGLKNKLLVSYSGLSLNNELLPGI